ncbi:MAG: ferritin-like protein [Myxococcales bacterium]|nr:ferritin-like protein [Myxococcales bacterium]
MLKIEPQIVGELRRTTRKEELYPFLQRAIELEHSTIPPYLTAWYSLRPGLNDEVGRLLRSVVIEEMLHMTISANILVSLGGHPAINHAGFVPSYPGGLPMGIGGSDFVVHIEAFSMELVKNTFMVIEEPEEPVPTTTETWSNDATPVAEPVDSPEPDYRTIGEFYAALEERLRALPDSDFGHVRHQVLRVWPEALNFPITDSQSACRAIDIIVEQGEGSSTDPFEEGEPAHYYRFGEIYYGAQLVAKPDGGKARYAYDGAPIAFVGDGVFPMRPDPSPLQFPAGTYGRMLSDDFTAGYSALLNSLHAAFNGEPARIRAAMGLMYQLRFLAQRLMSTPLERGRVETAGPVYRYVKP